MELETDILIRQLRQRCEYLEQRVSELERAKKREYLTPLELSQLFHCSLNNVYIKIRQGEIKALQIGRSYRIPMNQFEAVDSMAYVKQKIF